MSTFMPDEPLQESVDSFSCMRTFREKTGLSACRPYHGATCRNCGKVCSMRGLLCRVRSAADIGTLIVHRRPALTKCVLCVVGGALNRRMCPTCHKAKGIYCSCIHVSVSVMPLLPGIRPQWSPSDHQHRCLRHFESCQRSRHAQLEGLSSIRLSLHYCRLGPDPQPLHPSRGAASTKRQETVKGIS